MSVLHTVQKVLNSNFHLFGTVCTLSKWFPDTISNEMDVRFHFLSYQWTTRSSTFRSMTTEAAQNQKFKDTRYWLVVDFFLTILEKFLCARQLLWCSSTGVLNSLATIFLHVRAVSKHNPPIIQTDPRFPSPTRWRHQCPEILTGVL